MSLRNGRCDRCGEKTNGLTMSIFNTDMVCIYCLIKEQEHPKYKEAKRVEHEHVKNGDYNFKGIGLPDDL